MSFALSTIVPRIAKAYFDACRNTVDSAATLCIKAEQFAQGPRLRTGRGAVVTMPVSIMLRNGAHNAHVMTDNKNKTVPSFLAGLFGGIGGGFFAGKTAFGMLAAAASTKAVVSIAAVNAMMIGVLATPAAWALGIVGVGALVGAATAALSVFPAAMNIHVGLGRSMDAFHGKNYVYDLPPEAPGTAATMAAPIADTFNAEAATTLDEDISFKKVRLNFAKKPSPAPLQNIQ